MKQTSQFWVLKWFATLENYLKQNAEAEVCTQVVGGWLNVQTFAVCLHVWYQIWPIPVTVPQDDRMSFFFSFHSFSLLSYKTKFDFT